MKYYKILFISTISVFLYSWVFWFDFKTDCQEQTFVVTAYYSPLEDQTFYYKDWFDAEVILNGKWTHGASGKWVFNWMLAAPSTYDFGWKIYFPSLWIWEIADRGGAIVHAWEREYNHDRIDIWMWQWEEWLIRALTFGKRAITGYYCDTAKLKSLNANSKIKVWFNLDAIPYLKYFFDATLFIQQLNPERTDIRVYKLQEYLVKFGYMDKKTWYFGPETKAALCRYQIKRAISSQKYCGTFWERTRAYMKLEAKKKWFLPDFWEISSLKDLLSLANNYNWKPDIISDSTIDLKTQDYFTQAYKKEEKSPKIYQLQDMLRHYGFYNQEPNSIYDTSTINSIHNFQIAAGILKSDDYSNPARWRMWPSTRKTLNEKWNDFQNWKNQNIQ